MQGDAQVALFVIEGSWMCRFVSVGGEARVIHRFCGKLCGKAGWNARPAERLVGCRKNGPTLESIGGYDGKPSAEIIDAGAVFRCFSYS